MRSVQRLQKESVDCALSVNSNREVQRKGASQRGQKPLDTETEDATSLEAATKQRDCEH
jgi:hypothetical protein